MQAAVVQSDDWLRMAGVYEVEVEVVRVRLLEELEERFARLHCGFDPTDLHPPV